MGVFDGGNFKCEKLGRVFVSENHHEWMHGYASPVTSVEFDDFIRVYFSCRNALDERGNFKTRITFVDCDKTNPLKVLYVHDKYILELGSPGAFDEHGTMVADVVSLGDRYYMYYMGWQRSGTVPYLNRLGLAISDDGVIFTKVSEGPVIGIGRFLPFGIGNVSVLVENGVFKMWYTHYRQWINTDNGFRPNYDIRYATSANGLDWMFGEQCIYPANGNEALATPCVRRIGDKYHMWYSFRPGVDAYGKSGSYRIGYAISEDGKVWRRSDSKMNMCVSEKGWDSTMICYPDVLSTREYSFLFYCGNNYGEEGFGCAKISSLYS